MHILHSGVLKYIAVLIERSCIDVIDLVLRALNLLFSVCVILRQL